MPRVSPALLPIYVPDGGAMAYIRVVWVAGAGHQVYYSIIYRALTRQFADVELKVFWKLLMVWSIIRPYERQNPPGTSGADSTR
jgi:hypothetical protein